MCGDAPTTPYLDHMIPEVRVGDYALKWISSVSFFAPHGNNNWNSRRGRSIKKATPPRNDPAFSWQRQLSGPQNLNFAASCRIRGSAALWILPKARRTKRRTGVLKFV